MDRPQKVTTNVLRKSSGDGRSNVGANRSSHDHSTGNVIQFQHKNDERGTVVIGDGGKGQGGVGSGSRREGVGKPSVGQLIVAGGNYPGVISDAAPGGRGDFNVVVGGNGGVGDGNRGLSINAIGSPDNANSKPIVFSRIGRGGDEGNKVINLYQDSGKKVDQKTVVFGNPLEGNRGSGQSGPVSANESFSRDIGTRDNKNQTNGRPNDLNLYVGGEVTPIRDIIPRDGNYSGANLM